MESREQDITEGRRDLTPDPEAEDAGKGNDNDLQSEGSSSGIFSQEDLQSVASPSQVAENYDAVLQQSLMKFTMDDENGRAPDDEGNGLEQQQEIRQNPEQNVATGGVISDSKGLIEADGPSSADSEESSLSSQAEEQLKKPLTEALSDVAKFSYSSLVAVCLPNLFDNQWNKAWNLKTLKALSKYLKLPKVSVQTLVIMVEDPYHHDPENAEIFLGVLLEDPTLIKPDMIPKDMITRALQDGTYDARMRVLVKEISKRIGVRWKKVAAFEKEIVDVYEQEQHETTEEEKKERDKKAKIRKAKRVAMISAATIGGGVIIGLTGGLAAPLIASAGAALLGTSLGFFGTVAGAAVLGSILGAAGAGLSGYKMNKRVGTVEEFEFTTLTEGRDLHVTIAVSGWLTKDRLDNFTVPWLSLASCHEIYCLKWESKYLLELGNAIEYILDSVMTMAAKEALKMTVLAGILAAIALPAVAYSAISSSIDNPWSVAVSRASEAGKQLAEVLLSRQQGKRPVTLIGFSMGARVIFFCLKELSQRKGSEGLVQDVYLLGAPITSEVSQWKPFAKVVAGEIVNGYCRGDWLLQFVYRTASMQVSDIAGLEPVRWDDRRMVNVDLTDIVNGHLDYSDKMDEILAHVGLETRERHISSDKLSQLAEAKVTESRAKREAATATPLSEKDDSFVRIDASDLLIPKSASAMDLALARQRELQAEASRQQPASKGAEAAKQQGARNKEGTHAGATSGSIMGRGRVELGEDPLK